MNEEIKEKMEEVIQTELSNLSSLESGSEEMASAVEDIRKLHDMVRADEKMKSDKKDLNIDRAIKIGTTIGELGVPLLFYNMWMKRGFNFEKEGVVTSFHFRNLIASATSFLRMKK